MLQIVTVSPHPRWHKYHFDRLVVSARFSILQEVYPLQSVINMWEDGVRCSPAHQHIYNQ